MKPIHPSELFLNNSWLPFKSAFMPQQSKGMSCSPEQLFTLMPTSLSMNPLSLVKVLSWIHGIFLCLFGRKIRNISLKPKKPKSKRLSILFAFHAISLP
jgi:hypothetical protein